MEEIFDSVSDMHELTLNLISSLEDTLEATKEGEAVLIGSCFEDFMEVSCDDDNCCDDDGDNDDDDDDDSGVTNGDGGE